MQFRTHKKTDKDVSMQDAMEQDKEGNAITLAEKLADPIDLQQQAETAYLSRMLHQSLDVLDEREKEVICRRYGLCGFGEHTQRQVATRLGISRSYVSRLETRALHKLRKQIDG